MNSETTSRDMALEEAMQAERRGLFRRLLDWLLWDGEDDLEDEVLPETTLPRPRGRVVHPVRPPRRDVDSIDWQAFEEGRPQTESGLLPAIASEETSSTGESFGPVPAVAPPSVASVMASIRWQR
ncbi:MAG: hypothetical protein KDC95_09400 [Planctomycetes bacterium]|nr:hypothetical protein [Planctomycetota bacterium]